MTQSLIVRGMSAPSAGDPAPTRERAFDPARLRRGIQRGVLRLGPMQFRVQGSHQRYYDVDLNVDPPCYCADAQYRGRGCLHELVARLHAGDAQLIQSLGEMLLAADKLRIPDPDDR